MLNDIKNLKKSEILAPYTTYKIGGPADYFVAVQNQEELVNAVINARKEGISYFVLGTGANVLIGDKGYRGLVIKNESKKFYFKNNGGNHQLIVESGALISDLIIQAEERGLSGLEHFAGIPSTVGGAMWQNLHFLSPDRKSTKYISEIVVSAKVLDEQNSLISVEKDFFNFGYDQSIFHNREIIATEVIFLLVPKDKEEIIFQRKENLKWRSERHPSLESYPSCGSVFKKIEGVGAGRLIENVGLKGFRIGNVQVSDKHANFIVNLGGGLAEDVLKLIKMIQEEVKNKTGYILETEIKMIGEF